VVEDLEHFLGVVAVAVEAVGVLVTVIMDRPPHPLQAPHCPPVLLPVVVVPVGPSPRDLRDLRMKPVLTEFLWVKDS